MKPVDERVNKRSSMDYMNTPQMMKSMKPINPLVGESEGELRRKQIEDEYKEYVFKSMEETRGSRSTSKRMSRYLQKRKEVNSRSP